MLGAPTLPVHHLPHCRRVVPHQQPLRQGGDDTQGSQEHPPCLPAIASDVLRVEAGEDGAEGGDADGEGHGEAVALLEPGADQVGTAHLAAGDQAEAHGEIT